MARIGTRGGWIVALGLTLACTSGAPAGGAGPAAPPPAAATAAAPAAPATETARTPLKLKVGLVPGAPSSGIYLGIAHGYFAEEGLEVAIEPFDDDVVNWTILSFADQLPALANGAIDVGFNTEPFVARAVQTGVGVRWKGMDEFFPNHQLTVVIYNPDFARDHPDAARRWLVAYLRGARDFTDAFKHGRDKAGVVRVLIENTPIKDAALYEAMVPSGIDPDGALNQES